MYNIFENAYFGKAYKTRKGDKALFQYKDSCHAHLFTELEDIDVYLDGTIDSRFFDTNLDIVSEWKEEINEKELDDDNLNKLAWQKYPDDDDDDTCLYGISKLEEREAFKIGYRKAMEYMITNRN